MHSQFRLTKFIQVHHVSSSSIMHHIICPYPAKECYFAKLDFFFLTIYIFAVWRLFFLFSNIYRNENELYRGDATARQCHWLYFALHITAQPGQQFLNQKIYICCSWSHLHKLPQDPSGFFSEWASLLPPGAFCSFSREKGLEGLPPFSRAASSVQSTFTWATRRTAVRPVSLPTINQPSLARVTHRKW